MQKTLIKRISIAAFAVIALAVIIIPRLKSKKEIETGSVNLRGAVIPVSVKIVYPENFDNKLEVSGSVISNEEVELHSEISGKIISINFQEGSKVNKGDLLVKMNDADLQAQLTKAQVNKKNAEDKEHRQKILLSKNGISQETYETALNELNASIADIENIKAQIAKTEIRASFNGTIGLRYVSEGGYATPTTQIATLQNSNPVKIDFSIPQRYAKEISVGNSIEIKSAAGKIYNARVYAIEPKIDPLTRSLQIRASCSNNNGELVPGSYVSVVVTLNSIKNTFTVPTQALSLDISGEQLYLYKNGVAVPRKIESGLRTEQVVQVAKGISEGDTIIISGIMQLRPRAKVKIASLEN
jgi:membrane fusion protein, multidrug efflux system